MKNALPIVLLLLVLGLTTTNAVAQETAPAPQDTEEATVDTTVDEGTMTVPVDAEDTTLDQDGHSVEYVLTEAADDEAVTLRGQLTESLGDERYTFEDDSGTIQVRIDDDVFTADEFHEGIEVELTGEVDKDSGETVEVEVEVINIG